MLLGTSLLKIGTQTDLDDCANTYIMFAKNESMTGVALKAGKFSRISFVAVVLMVVDGGLAAQF